MKYFLLKLDDELHTKLKVKAAGENRRMHELVITAIKSAVSSHRGLGVS